MSSLRKVEAEGGKKVGPPVEIQTGTFAWLADVEGNTVGLWEAKGKPRTPHRRSIRRLFA